MMAWFGVLYPFFKWLCRKLSFLRGITRKLTPILGFRLFPLPWRRDSGNEPEINSEENKSPVGSSLEQVSVCEGQHGGSGGKRAADSGQESVSKRPKFDEDEFDSEEYRVETTDELYCGYDSTWESEQGEDSPFRRTRQPAASRYDKFSRFQNAARDMYNYRHDYPTQTRTQYWKNQAPDDKPNLKFYLGLIPSVPDGIYITDFHKEWYGEYDTLEYVHTYIQWLFPLQEPGMNYQASTLTKDEIKDFLENRTAKENLLTSYKLMLDFYGVKLCDEKTGEVERACNWKERFNNLNSHTHNNLRITRILKCLGTLGYRHYQAPLVRFFLEETLIHRELPNVKDSVLNYFVFAVLDKRQRRTLIKFAYLNYDCKDEFVWCPKKIQMLWSGLSKPQKQSNDKKDAGDLNPSVNIDIEAYDKVKEAATSEFVSYI